MRLDNDHLIEELQAKRVELAEALQWNHELEDRLKKRRSQQHTIELDLNSQSEQPKSILRNKPPYKKQVSFQIHD